MVRIDSLVLWGRHRVGKTELVILFGEAKWSAKPVGMDVLDGLKARSARVEWGRKGRRESFCLFSRSGFTPALAAQARREGVALFKGNELA